MQPDLIYCAVHALVLFEPHRRHKEVVVSEHVLLTETTNDDEVFDLINLWAKGYNSGWDGVMWGRRKVTVRYFGIRQIEGLDPGTVRVTTDEFELPGAAGPIRLTQLPSFNYTVRREHLGELLDGTVPIELWATPTLAADYVPPRGEA